MSGCIRFVYRNRQKMSIAPITKKEMYPKWSESTSIICKIFRNEESTSILCKICWKRNERVVEVQYRDLEALLLSRGAFRLPWATVLLVIPAAEIRAYLLKEDFKKSPTITLAYIFTAIKRFYTDWNVWGMGNRYCSARGTALSLLPMQYLSG